MVNPELRNGLDKDLSPTDELNDSDLTPVRSDQPGL